MKLSEEFRRRAKVFRDSVYHSDAKECDSFAEHMEKLEADAELGALVRRMPEGASLQRVHSGIYKPDLKWRIEHFNQAWLFAEPKEALTKALGGSL